MSKPSARQRPHKEQRAFLEAHEKAQKLAKRREAREQKPEAREGQGDPRNGEQAR